MTRQACTDHSDLNETFRFRVEGSLPPLIRLKVRDLVPDWEESYRDCHYSEQQIRWYVDIMIAWVLPVIGDSYLTDVQKEEIKQIYAQACGNEEQIKNLREVLRSFFTFARRVHLITESPVVLEKNYFEYRQHQRRKSIQKRYRLRKIPGYEIEKALAEGREDECK